jgi:hypothetical protein
MLPLVVPGENVFITMSVFSTRQALGFRQESTQGSGERSRTRCEAHRPVDGKTERPLREDEMKYVDTKLARRMKAAEDVPQVEIARMLQRTHPEVGCRMKAGASGVDRQTVAAMKSRIAAAHQSVPDKQEETKRQNELVLGHDVTALQ